MSEQSTEQAEQLTEEAFAALEMGHYDRVLELTSELRALEFSSCFEIEALLYLDQNQLARALQVLDEGTQAVPDLWLLWQLKGNVLSDLKRFDEALESYDAALPLEGADATSLRFNRATALWRDGRVKAALREVEEYEIADAKLDLRWRIEATQLGLWAALERGDDVAARADALFAEQEDLEIEIEEAGQLSMAFSQIGWALMDCKDSERAARWADAALEIDRTNGQALLLRRDTTPDLPLATKTFRVELQGRLQGGVRSQDEMSGVELTLQVVAPNAEIAQQLALELETPHWEFPLRVENCERIGVCDSQPICVYQVDEPCFYPLDEA